MPKKKMTKEVAVIEKSPYGKYSIEQIRKSEVDAFVIQVGKELFDEGGRIVFTKAAADIYCHKIQENLLDMLEGGNTEEKAEAMEALISLRVWPLRIN